MFCYACIFDLAVLDFVAICNGLVCIFVTIFVLCSLVGFSFSVPSQEIGWEERLRNDL